MEESRAAQPVQVGPVHPVEADAPIYGRLSSLLGIGVIIGIVPVVAGLVVVLISGAGGTMAFPGLAGLARGLLRGDAASLILLGILLILALPAVQALAAAMAFGGRGNRRFAWIAVGVLSVQLIAAVVAWSK